MTAHFPVLIILLPFFGAFLTPLFGDRVKLAKFLTLGVQTLGLWMTVVLFHSVLFGSGTVHYHLGGWLPPWGIEYVIDPLAAGFLLLINVSAFLTSIYLLAYRDRPPFEANAVFYALFLILNAGLLGMVATGDLFNFYVFLEISALSGYGLLSSSGNYSVLAVFRYLLVGTIGASFYLLGLGYIYASTGTLNMADLSQMLPTLMESRSILLGLGMIVTGLAIKTALFPLHGWMPDTYTYASPAILGFIAAVMTKVGGYALIRILFFIFPAHEGLDILWPILEYASWGAILIGSSMAIAQTDLRRMLAYSSVAQLGYIVLGIAFNSPIALIGALFHVLVHALMKGSLFFIAGGIGMKFGTYELKELKGIHKYLPWTSAAFVICSLSMMGLPPMAGFFSKWYLLLGAFEAGNYLSIAIMLLGSLLTAIYLFRLIELFYFSETRQPRTEAHLPRTMVFPILVIALLLIGIGLFNQTLVFEGLQPMLNGGVFAP